VLQHEGSAISHPSPGNVMQTGDNEKCLIPYPCAPYQDSSDNSEINSVSNKNNIKSK
jgi:hypothetical protein